MKLLSRMESSLSNGPQMLTVYSATSFSFSKLIDCTVYLCKHLKETVFFGPNLKFSYQTQLSIEDNYIVLNLLLLTRFGRVGFKLSFFRQKNEREKSSAQAILRIVISQFIKVSYGRIVQSM